MDNTQNSQKHNSKYYSKKISLTSEKNAEYFGACGREFEKFESCVEKKVGKVRRCEEEKLRWDLCNYENKVNLPLFTQNNIDPSAYLQRCQRRTALIRARLESLNNEDTLSKNL